MLTNRKYKSDKVVRPLLLFLGALPFIAYFLNQSQGVIFALLFLAGTTLFGFTIYRYYKEGNKKGVIFGVLVLLFLYAFFICGILFLKIKL